MCSSDCDLLSDRRRNYPVHSSMSASSAEARPASTALIAESLECVRPSSGNPQSGHRKKGPFIRPILQGPEPIESFCNLRAPKIPEVATELPEEITYKELAACVDEAAQRRLRWLSALHSKGRSAWQVADTLLSLGISCGSAAVPAAAAPQSTHQLP